MDFENTLGPWLGRTMKMIDYHVQDVFQEKNINLTKIQWIVLKKLHENDGIPQHKLAFLTNRDKASLARLITTMEKKNLVARIPSRTDKRSNHIHLTKHGEGILKETLPIMKSILKTLQDNISPEEIQATIAVIKKMQENLINNNHKLLQ